MPFSNLSIADNGAEVNIETITGTGEILEDTSATGRKRPWSKHKMSNQKLVKLFEVAREIDETVLPDSRLRSLSQCADTVLFMQDAEGNRKLKSANFCRVRVCPMCNWRRSLKLFSQVSAITDAILAEKKARFIFLTLTGDKDVIVKRHFESMKDGAMLANSGHFDCEINIPELESLSKSRRKVRNNIEEFLQKDGRKIYLLAEGRLVNLAAGDGHPAEIMDLSFGVQFFSMMHLLEHGKELKKEVHLMPNEVNVKLAELKLKSLGMAIDKLTAEQRAYLNME